ncbi:MAG: hypothetical protein KDE51_23070 [Anaerolineales bacterium]|nr:hypothetical protein [Anaerolineales bacterium]
MKTAPPNIENSHQHPLSKSIFLFIPLVIVLNILTFVLFALNTNTPVPASWGADGGIRNTFVDWVGIVAQVSLFPIPAIMVGILIVNRYRQHPIGRLLILTGLYQAIIGLMAEWVIYGNYTNPGQPLALVTGWLINWAWGLISLLGVLLPVLFPSGRFFSALHKYFMSALLLLFFISLFIANALEAPLMSSAYMIPNPFISQPWPQLTEVTSTIFGSMFGILYVSAFITVVIRYRRSTGRERQQLKWFFTGVAFLIIQTLLGFNLGSDGLGLAIGDILVNTALLWIIVGIGIALLRYNLYDIDIIIRRTLIYTVLSAVLAFIYFGSVILIQSVVTAAGGQQSPLIVVLSTLLIAALFNPLRQKIQAFIDRRFYRRKYNAEQILAQFAQTARDEVELEKLTAELVDVVQDTMQPQTINLWLKR